MAVEANVHDLHKDSVTNSGSESAQNKGLFESSAQRQSLDPEVMRVTRSGLSLQDEVKKMIDSAESVSPVTGTPVIVTIDGPAASGKSSVSREVARRMGWSWVSTGAFYRGLAFVAHRLGVDLADEDALVRTAISADWQVCLTPEETLVFLQGEDITRDISLEENGSRASQISSFPKVRKALLAAQRQCAEGVVGLVAEGRDCGTVVFPNAQVKIFLTARAEDRAARRALEEGRDLGLTIEEQKRRDAQDATRKAAPMQMPEHSHLIDTSALVLSQVVDQVEDLIRLELARVKSPADN